MSKEVIKIWASWCGPCKIYAKSFDKVKEELQNEVKFVDVNVEEDTDNIAGQFKVRGIPYTILLENGEQVKAFSGRMDEKQLKEFILN